MPSAFFKPVGSRREKRLTVPIAARVERRLQDVRIRVAEIGINAPTAANDVPPLPVKIVDPTDARLDVVAVASGIETEVLETDDRVQLSGPRRFLDC